MSNTSISASALTVALCTFANAAFAKDTPIKIAINEWTGQNVSAHIAGGVLQQAGFTVEYVTAGAVPQFAAIAQGNLHLQPEAWGNNVGNIDPKPVENGDIVVPGSLGLSPTESWM